MSGHQLREGVVFTRPYAVDDLSFADLVRSWIPSANASVISHVTNTLYPSILDGTQQYTNQLERSILFVSDYIVNCHSYWINHAFGNQTYGYQFSVPPGVHAQDTEYTLFNGPGSTDTYGTLNATVARGLQKYITSFAQTGAPEGQGEYPAFPSYGSGTILNLTDDGFTAIPDLTANQRCSYFQNIPEEPLGGESPVNVAAASAAASYSSMSYLGIVLTTLVGLVAV